MEFYCSSRLNQFVPSPVKVWMNSGSNTYKIMMVADVHYGEGEETTWGPEQDVNSTRVISNLLNFEFPDLVVFSGDQITGNNIVSNATKYMDEVVRAPLENDTPWAIIFGNHDDTAFESVQSQSRSVSSDSPRSELLRHDQTYELSQSASFYTSSGGRVSNYYLDIYQPSEETDPLWIARVWMLDTGGGSIPEDLDEDQLAWMVDASLQSVHMNWDTHKTCNLYEEVCNSNGACSLNEFRAYLSTEGLFSVSDGAVPQNQILFMHIPSYEYINAREKGPCEGMADDGITPTDHPSDVIDVAMSMGITHVFVGHDHGNDDCCVYEESMNLCFGRHTGYGGYGSWARGSRFVQFTIDEPLSTWVTLEDGTVLYGN